MTKKYCTVIEYLQYIEGKKPKEADRKMQIRIYGNMETAQLELDRSISSLKKATVEIEKAVGKPVNIQFSKTKVLEAEDFTEL